MGFPSSVQPPLQRIATSHAIFPGGSTTDVFVTAGRRSVMVIPNDDRTGGFAFGTLLIQWYEDVLASTLLTEEFHSYAPNGSWTMSNAGIVTAVKGAYCRVSGGGANLVVYSTDIEIPLWERLDQPASPPFAGIQSINITPGQTTGTAQLIGFARSSALTIVTQFSNTGTSAVGTFTAKYVVNVPNAAGLVTVTTAAVNVPASGTTVNTATATLALPWAAGGCPFEIDLTYTLSSGSSLNDVSGTTYVY